MIRITLYALLVSLCLFKGAFAGEVPAGGGGTGGSTEIVGGLISTKLNSSSTATSIYGGSQYLPAIYKITCLNGDIVCVNNPLVASEVDCTTVPLGAGATSGYGSNTKSMDNFCSSMRSSSFV